MRRSTPRPRAALAIGLAAALLGLSGGCALFSNPGALPAGTPIGEARTKLGPPTGEHRLEAGTRLEYATGPYGRHTWMLDFDAGGRLQGARQVLTEARFNTVRAGMSEGELRRLIGRPGETWRLGRLRQDVWVYRFETPFCIVFQVGVGDDGRVVDTGYVPDPMCDHIDPDGAGR